MLGLNQRVECELQGPDQSIDSIWKMDIDIRKLEILNLNGPNYLHWIPVNVAPNDERQWNEMAV